MSLNGEGMRALSRIDAPERAGAALGRIENPEPPRPPQSEPRPEHEPFDRNPWDEV